VLGQSAKIEIFMAQVGESPFSRAVKMPSLTLNSPAKINLMLSVHGRRDDGFHALTSLVTALTYGDRLSVSLSEGVADTLRCSDPAVPTGAGNLIIQAAEAFRARVGSDQRFAFNLEKRIPIGAGLGGGSSNAAIALRAMNTLMGEPLGTCALLELAASLGSDCPFFIEAIPAKMTGRGERLEPLTEAIAADLRGLRILLFRPDFGVETAWAYRQLVEARPSAYESEANALARLEAYETSRDLQGLLFNSFEPCVGAKYLAIPCILEQLRESGHACLMSGSGSCCFALCENAQEADAIREVCKSALGSGIFCVETSIL
jgi:4-diphosphocytidyl-2-C-methyl-D-erythritol kinase